jgi:hypothetical protein
MAGWEAQFELHISHGRNAEDAKAAKERNKAVCKEPKPVHLSYSVGSCGPLRPLRPLRSGPFSLFAAVWSAWGQRRQQPLVTSGC